MPPGPRPILTVAEEGSRKRERGGERRTGLVSADLAPAAPASSEAERPRTTPVVPFAAKWARGPPATAFDGRNGPADPAETRPGVPGGGHGRSHTASSRCDSRGPG